MDLNPLAVELAKLSFWLHTATIIDEIVYRLYGLTEEEIKIVKGGAKG